MKEIDARKYGFKEHDWEERARGDPPKPVKRFPKPLKKFHLVYQSFNQSVEEIYFWLLASLREDMGLHDVKKITDIFTSSEQSAFWGQAQQRLQIQQNNVQSYLATIGKLIKDLFQIVRELRILDERLSLYEASNKYIKGDVIRRKRSVPEEIVLRGYWVDMKDGGVKSPGSVYGLASTLGYVTLPDLFFGAPPMKREEVTTYVDSLDFNPKVKDVLKKKLASFLYWKEFTQNELTNRKNFTVKYLKQHYESIQLYISWVKPYLRNVKRLQQNFEKSMSEDIIGSFEGSFTEIEVICYKDIGKPHMPVVVLNIEFRTAPDLQFHQDGYQHKGPIHVGRTEFWLRGYTWTKKDMENYERMREEETFDILGNIDESLQEAIEALGDDIRKYIKTRGEKFPEDIKKEEEEKRKAEKKAKEYQMKGALEPFTALFSGFKEIFMAFNPPKKKASKNEPTEWELKKSAKAAAGPMSGAIWNTYKNFKKAHKMITW